MSKEYHLVLFSIELNLEEILNVTYLERRKQELLHTPASVSSS
jgi:hypothetical protein